VLAFEGAVLATPHLLADLEGLFEAFEALLQRREVEAVRAMLVLEPGRAERVDRAATRDHVERRRHLRV